MLPAWKEKAFGKSKEGNGQMQFEDYLLIDEDDYGATIAFGESVFPNHIIELDFEKEEIIDNRLNG